MSALSYRPFQEPDLPQVLALFQAAYGGRTLPEADYRHYFLEGNPFGPPMIELAFDAEQLVGHYALCPAESRVDGALVPSARSMATMTHPAHAGRGIFSELAERLYHRVFADHGTAFVWGFPNPNSHYGFVNKLGWSDLFSLHFLDLPTTGADDRAPALAPIDAAEAERRLAALPSTAPGVVPFARTARFLRWRYLHEPTRYTLLGSADDPSFAVVSTYAAAATPTAPAVRTLNLVDACAGAPRAVGALLAGVVRYGSTSGHDAVSVWTDLRSPVWAAAERLRGRPRGVITYAGVRAAPWADGDGSLTDPRRWRVSMGDSDVF